MSPGLLNKRSCPVLEQTPPTSAEVPSLLRDEDLEHHTGLCDLRIGRRRGSRVWSEIRGAIKAIGRGSRSGRCSWRSHRPGFPLTTRDGCRFRKLHGPRVEYFGKTQGERR